MSAFFLASIGEQPVFGACFGEELASKSGPSETDSEKKWVKMEPAELLKTVANLAKQGRNQKQIAKELGFSTTFTFNNRLAKASQATGKPAPAFRRKRADKVARRVETVEVKRRGPLV